MFIHISFCHRKPHSTCQSNLRISTHIQCKISTFIQILKIVEIFRLANLFQYQMTKKTVPSVYSLLVTPLPKNHLSADRLGYNHLCWAQTWMIMMKWVRHFLKLFQIVLLPLLGAKGILERSRISVAADVVASSTKSPDLPPSHQIECFPSCQNVFLWCLSD